MFEHILSTMIFLPLLTGLLLLVLPAKKAAVRALSFVVSLLVLICGVKIFVDYSGSGFLEFVEHFQWIKSLGISYSVGVDGLSLFILVLAAVFFPLLFLFFPALEKAHYCNLLLVLGAMIGAVAATDLALFYIFWELMLLPVFFLLGLYGGEKRFTATVKITLYTIAGSLCMLAALIWVVVCYHSQTGIWTFEMAKIAELDLHGKTAAIAFCGEDSPLSIPHLAS
jgi:NADH-quinone oxidoreductase subunit M